MREDTEYAAWASHMSRMRLRSTEDARRLARYDEAIRLLRELKTEAEAEIPPDEHKSSNTIYVCGKVEAFLADEGKVAG